MATSFTKNGDEYLWLRDKNFESTDRPRCGIPILFPVSYTHLDVYKRQPV